MLQFGGKAFQKAVYRPDTTKIFRRTTERPLLSLNECLAHTMSMVRSRKSGHTIITNVFMLIINLRLVLTDFSNSKRSRSDLKERFLRYCHYRPKIDTIDSLRPSNKKIVNYSRLLATLATLLLFSVPNVGAAAPAQVSAEAREIATVFHAQFARQDVVSGLWAKYRRPVLCLARAKVEDIGTELAPAIVEELSAEEISQTIEFLRTAGGRAFTKMRLARSAVEPSVEERRAMVAFYRTSAGTKLFGKSMRQRQTDTLAGALSGNLGRCEPQPQSETPKFMSFREAGCTPPKVQYPTDARVRGEEGKASVTFWVNEHGLVYLAVTDPGTGSQTLDWAAIDAVRSMTCTPGVAPDGSHTIVVGVQPIAFKLEN